MDATEHQLKAALYGRVSRLKDDGDPAHRERSVDQQLAANEKAAARYGWMISARYADPDRSASRFATRAREKWEKVVAAVKAHEFDVLVIWETSRASRDPEEWIPLLAECRRAGIKIYVTVEDELYDLTKPKHWKALASDGIANAFSSEETSQRVKRDADASAEAGRPSGPVLFGYERIYDYDPVKRKVTLVEQRPHPENAPVVKYIITSVYEGKSLKSIARKLNEDGVKSPRGSVWGPPAVRRTCLNSGYIGLRGHNGSTTQGTWKPIVDSSVFYGARRILLDPKRTTTRPGRAKWLLSCIATCAVCNGPMAVMRRGSNRTVYVCRDRGHLSIERTELDDYATGLVITRLSRTDAYVHLPDGSEETVVTELRAEEAALRAELDGYADDAAEGRIDRLFASKVVSKLTAKITEVQRRIEQAITPPALLGLLSGAPGESVADRWHRAPISAKREVLRLLFSSVTVAKGAPGEVAERVALQWRDQANG
ncbi:MAG TPA: recombinase family protein [Pseudonocardiaceae bacterium]|jgi:DNA invertase Pin-like site-specific DNA recombinase|nr:recombinase family protein [Pseudonocardiaceae bacterium]